VSYNTTLSNIKKWTFLNFMGQEFAQPWQEMKTAMARSKVDMDCSQKFACFY